MQFSLLDSLGNETSSVTEIQWIDVEKLFPHPDNPRLIFKTEIVDAIASSIEKDGFQPCYALLVRPFEDGYQILSGHTRLKASQQVGVKKLPCWVKEMTDEEAFFELVKANAQGELYPLEIGIHALKYVELSEGGRGKKGGLSEYAREIGKAKDTISGLKLAAQVYSKLSDQSDSLLEKSTHLSHISKTPESYWQQLTELLIKNEWSVKQTEEICRAVRDIDIPEYFQEWLNPDKYIKKTISEALTDSIRTPKDVNNWVKTADKHYQSLDSEAKVTLIVDDKEVIEYRNLKTVFLTKLLDTTKGDKAPSIKKIDELALQVRKEVDVLNEKHLQWVASQASEKAKKEIEQQKEKELLERKIKYSPSGYNDCLLNILPNLEVKFNAIITDPPYLLSNDGITVRSGKQTSVNKNFADSLSSAIHPEKYLQLFADCLIDGGYFVFTCTHHLRDIIRPIASNYGFEFIQDLIWHKPNATPLLTADRFKEEFEYISIYKKGNNSSYFGYEEIKDGDSQKGSLITINQCGGNERLGWHDTQKPLALMELLIKAYCPENGFVLDPFAGTGTTAIACKKLKRICYWIEQEKDFFNKTQSRIDESKFSWE